MGRFSSNSDCKRAKTYLQDVHVLLTKGNTEREGVTGVSTGQTEPSLRGGLADLVDVEGSRHGNEAEQSNDKQSTRHASTVGEGERAQVSSRGDFGKTVMHEMRLPAFRARDDLIQTLLMLQK